VNYPSDDTSVMKCLLDLGIDANALLENQESPLLAAIRGGSKEKVRILLDYGADRNLMCYGKSPLQHAMVLGNRPEICKLLDGGK
jgi:cytochrome c